MDSYPYPYSVENQPYIECLLLIEIWKYFTKSTVKDPVEEGGQGDERCLHGRDGGDGGHGGVRKGILV